VALARQTKRDVGLSRQNIAATEGAIEAEDMPFVIATPTPPLTVVSGTAIDKIVPLTPGPRQGMRFRGKPGSAEFHCRLWNIGKGPVMVMTSGCRSASETSSRRLLSSFRSRLPAPPTSRGR